MPARAILNPGNEEADSAALSSLSPDLAADPAPAAIASQAGTISDFKPYPIDWRFLPETALLVKDTVRHAVVSAGMTLAEAPATRPLWRAAFRRSMVPPVLQAGRLFIHIPKTGGTSICARLYGRNLPHVTAAFWQNMFGRDVGGVPSFAVLREPLERLGSAYRFIKHGGTDIMAASRHEMFKLRGADTFEAFVDRLWDRPHLLRTVTTLRPQTDFVCDASDDVLVDHLFRMSSGATPEPLMKWLGVVSLPRINRSPMRPFATSRRAVSLVEQIYEKDFDLFFGK